MRRFENFLFFYSIAAITVIFLSFGIYSPKPLNFISGILLLPIIFYFWTKLTHPENLNPDKWSFRFLIAIVLVSLLGIFGFYLTTYTLPQVNELKKEVLESQALSQKANIELASVSAELSALSIGTASANIKKADTEDVSISDLIIPSPSSDFTQRITAIDSVASVDVYQNPSATSKKIGALLTGIYYPYITMQNGWYKIVMDSSKTGWVSDSQVREQ